MSELRWWGGVEFWLDGGETYWVWIDHTELTARRATPDEVAGWPEDEYYDEAPEDVDDYSFVEHKYWLDYTELRANVYTSHNTAVRVTWSQGPRGQ
jgi:hypothetical protein